MTGRRPLPLPGRFRLRFAADVTRPVPSVLIGGSPLRVLRLTAAGASQVDRWSAGAPVGTGRGAGLLAARLVESGLALPIPPAEPTDLSVAVVIPVRNDPGGLAGTFDALADTQPDIDVVVVDDGSDPPLEPGPAGSRRIRRDRSGGPARARNDGWKAAGPADVIAFVDAGCRPLGDWLGPLMAHFADPAVAAVAPRITTDLEPDTPGPLGRYEVGHSPLDMGPTAAVVGPGRRVSYVPSTVLVVRRADLVAVGGFDESLRFGEDVDLVWRLRAAGRRVVYEPSARATHPARPSWLAWLRQRHQYGSSAAPLADRHGRSVAPLGTSPWSNAVWLLVLSGHPIMAAGLTVASASVLARRAGGDREVAAELARLATVGTLLAGRPLASAVRRAWLPPAVVVAVLSWRYGGRSTRRRILASVLAVVAASGRPGDAQLSGSVEETAVALADDLAYQSGVWAGVVRNRSLAALVPNW